MEQKIVVRRLPPNLPQDIFESTINPFKQNIIWFQYIQGKVSKESRHSRAYLVFQTNIHSQEFIKLYNGHGFKDSKGTEYYAVVEVAPFQKYIPLDRKRKEDQRVNTIEEDEMYKLFVETLGQKEVEVEEQVQQVTTTPLIEALKHIKRLKALKKAEQKAKKAQENEMVSLEGKEGKKKKRNRKKKDGVSGEVVSRDSMRNESKDGPRDSKSISREQSKNMLREGPSRDRKVKDSSKNDMREGRDSISRDNQSKDFKGKEKTEKPRLILKTKDGMITKIN